MYIEKKLPKRGEDYDFIDLDGVEKITSVKILKGKYENVIYHYGKVEVLEDESSPTLKFDYYIDSFSNFEVKKLNKDEKFFTLMGDILISIFDENVIMKEKNNESFGNNNTEEFDLQ